MNLGADSSKYFDDRAHDFDTPKRQARAKVIADTLKQTILPEYITAMEFGCGTGLVGMELVNEFDSILFVDTSREMIKKLQQKIAMIPSAKAQQIDLTREPLEQQFDYIFSSMVLHHITDIENILRVLQSRLRPGGMLALVDLNPVDVLFHSEDPDFAGHHGFAQSEMAQWLAEAGFADIRTETFFEDIREMACGDVPYSLFLATASK